MGFPIESPGFSKVSSLSRELKHTVSLREFLEIRAQH